MPAQLHYVRPLEIHLASCRRRDPVGHIPLQIEKALAGEQRADWLKLYNASNFFDPLAVPLQDYARIAELCNNYERIVVENHPRFDNKNIGTFRDLIQGQLELAIGVECLNDEVLRLLNKQLTIKQSLGAIEKWLRMQIDVRVFLLINPPHTSRKWDWLECSVQAITTLFDIGVRHISFIPTRASWGLLKQWVDSKCYVPTRVADVERLAEIIQSMEREGQTISIDVWDWEELLGQCPVCAPDRKQRIVNWNQTGTLFQLQPANCCLS